MLSDDEKFKKMALNGAVVELCVQKQQETEAMQIRLLPTTSSLQKTYTKK